MCVKVPLTPREGWTEIPPAEWRSAKMVCFVTLRFQRHHRRKAKPILKEQKSNEKWTVYRKQARACVSCRASGYHPEDWFHSCCRFSNQPVWIPLENLVQLFQRNPCCRASAGHGSGGAIPRPTHTHSLSTQ